MLPITNLGLRSDKNWEFEKETAPAIPCSDRMPGRLNHTHATTTASQ